jgi:hypothetical protein
MLRLTTILLLSSLSVAHAAQGWITKAQDDIFSGGQTATMIGLTHGGDAVYLSCDSDRKLEVAFISKTDDKMDGIPAELVAKVDGGETLRFAAVSYAHNDDFIGFRSDDQDGIKSLVEAIGKARKSTLFGLQIPAVGYKASISPGVTGSTKAATNFRKACID